MNKINYFLIVISGLFVTFVQIECSLSEKQYKIHDENSSSSTHHTTEKHHKSKLSLVERLELEKNTFHWYPYQRISIRLVENDTVEEDCIARESSIDDFPTDIFSQEARIRGAVLLHFFGAIYFFVILAIICDHYFLPSVECICQDLGISENVAAATFMATATSMPEFFTNTISVFLAESDMGLGTIIGAMLFNTLGVGAAAAIAAPNHLYMDWWPVTRDSIVNSWNLCALVAITWDGRIDWYETIIFMVLYVLYFVVMFQNPRIMKFVKKYVEGRWNCCKTVRNRNVSEGVKRMSKIFEKEEFERRASQLSRTLSLGHDNPTFEHGKLEGITTISDKIDSPNKNISNGHTTNGALSNFPSLPSPATQSTFEDEDEEFQLWQLPRNSSKLKLLWHFFIWPSRFVLYFLIPDPRKYRKWYPLTFILCMITIGGCAYFVFWMVVIIGYTFGIPEPIMGLTFLAAGGCLPETVSTVLVARSGSGGVGVSNALGANSLNILFSLGFPWFLKTMIDGAGFTGAYIHIFSFGIAFVITSLLLAILCLYIVLAIAKFTLRKRVGIALFSIYGIFVTFAILMELDIFADSGRCPI